MTMLHHRHASMTACLHHRHDYDYRHAYACMPACLDIPMLSCLGMPMLVCMRRHDYACLNA